LSSQAQAVNRAGTAEADLVRRARAGDRNAFDALRLVCEPSVRRFVRRLAGTAFDHDDIVQDAFLALYMNLHRLEPVENLRPFLYRIARNRCYDELRRQGRYDTVSLEGGPDRTAPVVKDRRPGPSEALDRTLAYADLRAAVARLPEDQRQALILYVDEGMSYAEIAFTLATDVNNVKARIHRARKDLARRLSPETLAALGVRDVKDS